MDEKPVSDCSDAGFFFIYKIGPKDLWDSGYDKYFKVNHLKFKHLNDFWRKWIYTRITC